MGWKHTRSINAVKLFETDNKYAKELGKAILLSIQKREDMTLGLISAALSSFSYDLDAYYKYGLEEYSLGLPTGSAVSHTIDEAVVTAILLALAQAEQQLVIDVAIVDMTSTSATTTVLYDLWQTSVTALTVLQEEKVIQEAALLPLTGQAFSDKLAEIMLLTSQVITASNLANLHNHSYLANKRISDKSLVTYTNEVAYLANLGIDLISLSKDTAYADFFGREYLIALYGPINTRTKIFTNNPHLKYIQSSFGRYLEVDGTYDLRFFTQIKDISDPNDPNKLINFYPPEPDKEKEYVQAAYNVIDVTGLLGIEANLKLWVYDVDTNVYPQIINNSNIASGALYYPVVPIRLDKQDLAAKNPKPAYITTGKVLLDKLGIDLQEAVDGINDNNDVQYIEDVFILVAPHINTQNKYSIRYMIEYFLWLDQSMPTVTHSLGQYSFAWTPNIHTVTEGQLGIKLTWSSISYTSGIVGSLGKGVGYAKSKVHPFSNAIWGGFMFFPRTSITFYHQDTPTTYRTLTVIGLTYQSYHGKNIYSGVDAKLEAKSNKAFVIPLNRAILKSLPTNAEAEIAYDSVTMLIHMTVSVYTPWWMLLIKILIYVVLVLLSFTPLVVFTIPLLIMMVALEVIGAIIEAIFEPKAAAAIMLVISLIMIVATAGGSLAKVADAVMKGIIIAMAIIGAVIKVISTVAFTIAYDVGKETTAFGVEAAKMQEELDAKIDLLGKPSFDPLAMGELFTDFYETADEFYYRSYLDNPSVRWMESHHVAIANMLKLPELGPDDMLSLTKEATNQYALREV
mgnify:CR=1 FL=1